MSAAESRRQGLPPVERRAGRLPTLPEAVALSVHLQDVNAVSEAVQQGAGQPLRAEDLGPLVEGQIGGDQYRPSLVSLAEDLEEELSAGLGERYEAQLVDDEQFEPGQPSSGGSSSRRSSLASISAWTSEAAVVKPTDSLLWQAASPRPRATWVLPVPLLPIAMTFSRRSTYSQRDSCMTRCLFTDGMARKSKVSKLLTAGKRAALILRSTALDKIKNLHLEIRSRPVGA